MSKRPESLNLGVGGGLFVPTERPDGTREIQAGGVRLLDAESAATLAAYLEFVAPWLDRTGVRDNSDRWERQRRGVKIGPRRGA